MAILRGGKQVESVAFEQLVQAVGVPLAVALWIWWSSHGVSQGRDVGEEVVKELRSLGHRLTRLEVIVDERTRK